MRSRKGRVESAEPVLEGHRLRVRLAVLADGEGRVPAYLPEREVAALLPRSALTVPGLEAPRGLLHTLRAILARQIVGRTVRLWSYRERSYASFLPWRSVRFVDEEDDGGATTAANREPLNGGSA